MFANHEREVEKFMGKAYTKLESYEDIGTVEINKELEIKDRKNDLVLKRQEPTIKDCAWTRR